jgi:hypothetical protein
MNVKDVVIGLGGLAAVIGFLLLVWVVVYGSLSDNPWLAIPSRVLKGGYGPLAFILGSLLVLLVLWAIWLIGSRGLRHFADKQRANE